MADIEVGEVHKDPKSSDYFANNYLGSLDINIPLKVKDYIISTIRGFDDVDTECEAEINNFAGVIQKFVLSSYEEYHRKMKQGDFSITKGFKGNVIAIALYVEEKIDGRIKNAESTFCMLEIFNIFDIDKEAFEAQVHSFLNTRVFNTAFDLMIESGNCKKQIINGLVSVVGRYIATTLHTAVRSQLKFSCCVVRDINKLFESVRVNTLKSHEGIRLLKSLALLNREYEIKAKAKVQDTRQFPLQMTGTGEYFGCIFDTYLQKFSEAMLFDMYYRKGKITLGFKDNLKHVTTNIISFNGPVTMVKMVGEYFITNIQDKYIKHNLLSVSPFNSSIWFSHGLKAVLNHARGQAIEDARQGKEINEEMMKKSLVKVFPLLILDSD